MAQRLAAQKDWTKQKDAKSPAKLRHFEDAVFFLLPSVRQEPTSVSTTSFHPFLPGQQGSLVAATPPQPHSLPLRKCPIWGRCIRCWATGQIQHCQSNGCAPDPSSVHLCSISSHSSKQKNMQSPLEECHQSIARCGRMVLNQGVTSTLRSNCRILSVFTGCWERDRYSSSSNPGGSDSHLGDVWISIMFISSRPTCPKLLGHWPRPIHTRQYAS